MQRLEDVRRRGLARQGLETFYRSETMINAFSAPVLDASGRAVLALTAVGEANRFRADLDGDIACALRETARKYLLSGLVHMGWTAGTCCV